MAIPAILKGDTSGNIVLDILAGYEYAGCTLAVVFNGVRKEFTGLVAGGTKSLQYTADETAGMPLGTAHATLTLTNAAGVVRSMPWVRIRVTDIPSEIYDRHITVDPSQLDVPDATAGDSLGAVKAKLNAVMAFLRGGAACLVACFGLSAFGDLCPTNTLNDVPGDTTISNLVVASGVPTGGGGGGGGITATDATNAAAAVVVRDVPSWARQATPPAEMADNALVLTNGAVKTKDGTKTIGAADINAYAIGGAVFSNDVAAIVTRTNIVGFTEWNRYRQGALEIYLVWMAHTSTWWMKYDDGAGGAMFDTGAGADATYATRDRYEFHRQKLNGENALGLARLVDLPDLSQLVRIVDLTNTAMRVANRTWDTGYQILWEKQAVNGGFYEVCVTNVNTEVQQ